MGTIAYQNYILYNFSQVISFSYVYRTYDPYTNKKKVLSRPYLIDTIAQINHEEEQYYDKTKKELLTEQI